MLCSCSTAELQQDLEYLNLALFSLHSGGRNAANDFSERHCVFLEFHIYISYFELLGVSSKVFLESKEKMSIHI